MKKYNISVNENLLTTFMQPIKTALDSYRTNIMELKSEKIYRKKLITTLFDLLGILSVVEQ